MKIIKLISFLILGILACNPPMDKRSIFDAKGQKPITSSVSKRFKTVSILFGNEKAMEMAVKRLPHRGGEMFTLVTWNQQNNKFWYPGLINGSIKSIEVVKIDLYGNHLKPTYTLTKGVAPSGSGNRVFTPDERVDYITGQRASVYP